MTVKETVYIKFFANVDMKSVTNLMSVVHQQLNEGTKRFVILVSSPGGNIFASLSVYNFLKGIPAEVITHNFGSVDIVSIPIYCSGSKRYCVPRAIFTLVDLAFDVSSPMKLDERVLDERIKNIKQDRLNISRIIAENTGKSQVEVESDILKNTRLDSEQAQEYGLVHEIKEGLFEEGEKVIPITS